MKSQIKIIIIIVITIIIGRLFQMQVLKTDYYKLLSEKDRLRSEVIPAPRGRIFSREGEILAESRPSYSIIIDPYQVDPTEITRLSNVLDMKEEAIYKKVKPHFRTSNIRRVSFDEISRVIEEQELFPSIRVITEPVRYYPYDSILSHLLGYTGEITDEELKDSRRFYRKGDIVGKKGVEKSYEYYLRGKKGVNFVEVDVRGRVVRRFDGSKATRAERGNDIYLTISKDLTLYADSLLKDYKCAALIAMDPRSGEILLYYSKPGYPSNKMTEGIPVYEWDTLRYREDAPLWDRIISGEYPPGSIFKIPTAIIALENGVLDEWKEFEPCKESLYIGDRYFGCWKKHGKLRLKDAIIQSCDVFFYQVGMSMSLEEMIEGARKLGFGKECGIGLPGERGGFLPSREWYNEKYGRRGWDRGVLANLAIGQGEILITPLQLVTFFSSIANNGWTYTPYIISEIRNKNGEIIKTPELKKITLPISSSVIDIIRESMEGVVNNEKGTAYWTRLREINVAGKTGTAQNPQGEDHSLFVGFAPFHEPKIVVFTVVENSGHGSVYAAPITTKIIKRYLSKTLDSLYNHIDLTSN
jgi:penicillin-binding protein 2